MSKYYFIAAGAKLSARSGNIVYAEDILKEAVERAKVSIQEKNPEPLIKTLNGYEVAVLSAAEKYEPSIVARYIILLATALILHAPKGTKQARIYIVNLVQSVLKNACGLLGMECPEEM